MDRGYSTHSRNLMGGSLEKEDQPVLTQLKKAYWTTKQQIRKTIGKKEDEHVQASDAELDAKLELFQQIKLSCVDLLRVILTYQKRLVTLAKEENAMGKFLKSQSEADATQAGKMMCAVGKSQTFSAQHRIQMRYPLFRLFQEVETFRSQAIVDTQLTVTKMEEARTEYRGALLWMKDVSERLDPEAFNKLDKFRKVQNQVRKAKELFDKHKLDVLQKVDLLAASRSNMFSHALAAYQTALLSFWKKMSKTMNAVSETFQGFQYYEFSLLKDELGQTSKQLAKETASQRVSELLESLLKDTGDNPTSEEDKLIYDIIMSLQDQHKTTQNAINNQETASKSASEKPSRERKLSCDSMTGLAGDLQDPPVAGLIEFDESELDSEDAKVNEQFGEFQAAMEKETKAFDLMAETDSDRYDALRDVGNELLEDIFGPEQPVVQPSLGDQIPQPGIDATAPLPSGFLPSDFIDSSNLAALQLQGQVSALEGASSDATDLLSVGLGGPQPPPYSAPTQTDKQPKAMPPKSSEPMSSWFDLFADLDPLQDPDAVGQRKDVPNDGYNKELSEGTQATSSAAALGPCIDNEHLQLQV